MENSNKLKLELEGVIQNIDQKFYILTANRPRDDMMHNNDCQIHYFLTGENGCIKYQRFNPSERCNFRLHLEMLNI